MSHSAYEDDVAALKATVMELGGFQKVGALLWPDKTPQYAGRAMADCCNPNRPERLRPSQLLFVMRLARDEGCHHLAEHFMAEAGYDRPEPVDEEQQAADIIDRIDSTLDTLTPLVNRLERLRSGMRSRVVG